MNKEVKDKSVKAMESDDLDFLEPKGMFVFSDDAYDHLIDCLVDFYYDLTGVNLYDKISDTISEE